VFSSIPDVLWGTGGPAAMHPAFTFFIAPLNHRLLTWHKWKKGAPFARLANG
jgi:hypothetical protein